MGQDVEGLSHVVRRPDPARPRQAGAAVSIHDVSTGAELRASATAVLVDGVLERRWLGGLSATYSSSDKTATSGRTPTS